MKYSILILFAFWQLISPVAQAQEQSWDLLRCINYALENNIQIKQQAVGTDYYGNELKQARNNQLPTLTGNLSNSFNFGRSLQIDNTFANVNSSQLAGSMGANLTLFNGMVLKNSIDAANYNLQASLQDLQKVKDNILLYVTASYLQILFAEELASVAQDQVEVTKLQIDRTRKLVEAGSLARGSLLEIEAQHAQEELNLVNQQNSLQLAYLDLYQLLELPASEQFKISKPELPVVSANRSLLNSTEVFQTAVMSRPEVKGEEFRLKSFQEQVAIAKGSLYPTLSVGADYFNSYNNQSTDISGNDIPFSDQLKNNDRYSVGLNLRIPIFNKFQTQTQIKNAELQVVDQQLKLQDTKNVLRKDIEQAYANAVAALKKYMAANKAVDSMSEAFRYMEEKFNVGMVNSVEYNQAKTNLTKAKSDLAQAKYDYIFRSKILDFYNGIPIEL